MKDSFLSVKSEFSKEYIIQKSKFISSIARVNSEDEAKEFLTKIKGKYSDATHNCYAYIADSLGLCIKCSDDGEPQGTAGVPILEALKTQNLFTTIVVVTRYFGGIKLGTGGLFRAYFDCAKDALQSSTIVNNILSSVYSCTLDYSSFAKFNNMLMNKEINILSKDYLDNGVKTVFAITKEYENKLLSNVNETFSGKVILTKEDERFEEYL